MEMTLTVHLPRRRPRPVDVVVEWFEPTTVAQLCAALADHLGEPVPGLTSRGRPVPADGAVGVPPLVHGASVAVGPAGPGAPMGPASASGVLDLVVVGGPDAGRSLPLVPPGVVVGRVAAGGLTVGDEALSRRHLFVAVGPSGVTVEDLGSTNGVWVDGERITTARSVDAGSTVVAGSTTLRLRRSTGAGAPVTCPGDGTVRVTPLRAQEAHAGVVEIACPTPPPTRHRPRVPWFAAMATVPVAIALAVFLGPQLLLFALLGPVSMLATSLGDRWGSGRAGRRELAAHAAAVAGARRRLADAVRSEAERLDRAHHDPASVLAVAEHHLAGLWRGGGRWSVRLGLGAVPTRVAWVEDGEREHPSAERAPVVLDLTGAGVLGVLGPPGTTDRFLAGLVGQLCTALPPHRVAVSVLAPGAPWAWVERLPHASSVEGTAARLLVVPVGRGSAGAVRDAREAGATVLVGASAAADLPDDCGAVVDLRGQEAVLDTSTGRVPFVPDLVGGWWADRLSRALAPLRCSEQVGTGRLPTRLPLAEALGGVLRGAELTAERLREHWAAGAVAAAPAAVVGRTRAGPYVVHLGRDGPHLLVGGTTGSGKSEFLRTLVLSLALAAPPEQLTFVLVDFKGGAAFAPCADLPHVVGLVTDLDDHLVTRALASLRAELRRREHLFAEAGAGDLAAYQRVRAPGAEAVPRLVVVVDELRALVDELPGFVSGLVRLAALGRSLGVHLVLATQRPSGAVSAEIQANVSLRIAFRVRDRADSVDVIEDPAAAGIPASTPGRGFSRGGDGVLVEFQAATVSDEGRARIGVRPLRVRAPDEPAAPDVLAGADGPGEAGSVDALSSGGWRGPRGLTALVQEAHRLSGAPHPRAPWLPPLPTCVEPILCGPGLAAGDDEPRGVDLGLVDEPDLQRVGPLLWQPADGPWLLAGPSASGRTTALRTLVVAAASRFGPEGLHVHVIDAHGALADLGALPHVGVHARADDLRSCTALAHHLREEVDRRLAGATARDRPAGGPSKAPVTLLVVDGWDHLVEGQPAAATDLAGDLLRVLRDGRSVGVVGAVAGGRSLLHPRWHGVGEHTFLLGAVDPLDAALAGLRSADLPQDPPPGRAVRLVDRREVQFAAATPTHTSTVASRAGGRPAQGGAWRWRALPALVRRHPGRDQPAGDLLLGLAAGSLAPCSWRPVADGRRLLVAGPPGSGRTTALCAVADSLVAAGRRVALVTDDPTGWDGCAAPTATALSEVVDPGDPDALVALRRRWPHLAVLVDDVERLVEAPVEPVLREVAALVDRDDGLLAAATSSVSLTTRFRGLDVELARYRCTLLLAPTPADRDLAGRPVPDGIPRVPGRGVFARRGELTEVQVLLSARSLPRVAPGQHLGVGVPGHPRGDDRDHGHHDHRPAHEHAGALHEAEPDRQQDRVPGDGGGARPLGGAQPPTHEQPEPGGTHEDEDRRHQHPRGVASLAQHELDDVEHREAGQGEGL